MRTQADREGGAPTSATPVIRRSTRLSAVAARVPWWALLAVAVGLAAVALWRLKGAAPDDAWITYRYARNLADGHGWTFNPGEGAAGGATSPLYVLILALGAWAGVAVLTAANVVFVLSLGAAGCLTALALRRMDLPIAAVAVVPLLVLNPFIVPTRGMEAALFLAVTAGALLAAVDRRWLLAGALAALSVAVRGDGALVVAALGVWALVERRGLPWRYVGGAAAVLVPWAALMLVLAGGIVPGTLDAKVAQGASGFWAPDDRFLRNWLGYLDSSGLKLTSYTLGIVALAALGLRHAAAAPRSRAWLAALVGSVAVFVVAYGLVLDVPGYPWYYALPWYAAMALAAVGVDLLLTTPPRVPAVLGVPALAAVVLLGMLGTSSGIKGDYRAYWDIGSWLRENTAADATVAASEVGIIGWSSQRPIIDYLGLLDPQSRDELRDGDVLSWVWRHPPDYWVRFTPPIRVESQVANAAWFPYAFEPVHRAGRFVVFARQQPLADAEADYRAELTQDAEDVGRTLSEAGLEPPSTDAVEALLHVVASRPDVRDHATEAARLRLDRVATWALEHGPKVPELWAELEPWAGWYRTVAAFAEASGALLVDPTELRVLVERGAVPA